MLISFLAGVLLSLIVDRFCTAVLDSVCSRVANTAQKGIQPVFMLAFRSSSVVGLISAGSPFAMIAAVLLLGGNLETVIYMALGILFHLLITSVVFAQRKIFCARPVLDGINALTLVAALMIAQSIDEKPSGRCVLMVMLNVAFGLAASVAGVALVRFDRRRIPAYTLDASAHIAIAAFFALTALATALLDGFEWRIWIASVIGIPFGIIEGIAVDYCSEIYGKYFRSRAADACGRFSGILDHVFGLASAIITVMGFVLPAQLAYMACIPLGGKYAWFGVAMSAVGMCSLSSVTGRNQVFGTLIDRFGKVGGMLSFADNVKDCMQYDSKRNTYKVITNGFLICTIGLTLCVFIVLLSISALKL